MPLKQRRTRGLSVAIELAPRGRAVCCVLRAKRATASLPPVSVVGHGKTATPATCPPRAGAWRVCGSRAGGRAATVKGGARLRCSMSISTRVSADFDSLRRFNEFLGELSCVICLEPLADPVTLACSHSFCRECILRALSVAPVCPLCKTVTARRGLKDDAFLAQLVQAAVQQREILRAQVEAGRAQPPAALRFSQQETQAPSSPAQSRRVQPRRVQAADLQASSPHLPRRLGCSALQALRPLLMRARVAPCRWRPSTSTPSRKSRTALRPCARTWQVWSRPRATTPELHAPTAMQGTRR